MTLQEMREKIKTDLDLDEEELLHDYEIDDHINNGVKDFHKNAVSLYEDYYLTDANIALVADQQDYSLPSDIFANKIRKIMYNDGSNKYIMRRFRRLEEIIDVDDNEDEYGFIIVNSTANKTKLRLYPASKETSSSNVTIFYTREPEELTDDDDTIDAHGFERYIELFAKDKCLQKDLGNPIISKVAQELAKEEVNMITTLENMVNDDDNAILADLSFYDDFDHNECY